MSVSYQSIRDQFDDVFGDPSRYRIPLAQVDRFAARALVEICERCRYKVHGHKQDSVIGQNVYSTSAATSVNPQGYDVFRVEYDDEILWPITTNNLRHQQRNWETASGRPRFYFLDEVSSSQVYPSVGIWEAPSSVVTDGVTIWYHPYPSSPSSSSGLTLAVPVDIPEWACGAMLFYMLHLAYSADTQMKSPGAAAVYKMLYEDIMDRLQRRSRDNNPKAWVSGRPASPTLNVMNRLPQRITP